MRKALGVTFAVMAVACVMSACGPRGGPATKEPAGAAPKEARWGYVGGQTVKRDDAPVKNTNDKDIYLNERYDLTAYRIPVKNGAYMVKLHFAETYEGITDAGQRVFSVTIEGKPVLVNFDPYKEAGNQRLAAIVKQFGVEAKDGEMTIEFQPNVQKTMINGIEVLGTPRTATAGFELRINCGAGEDYKDKAGHVWKRDQEFKAQP